ncbi:hypothetical protein WG66_011153 [Moniliophthora roreri]|uniref:Uncharacterized protein n=1 Tax=Moniliophthora roreri TaxID=221103 RepID=A0A0W0FJ95_MONRR|nr:hypothetical protein WG66_011153 [Moniliophthora roreri]
MDTPGWTSIRPWIPPLSLSVREITSVSVTFVLSASSAPGDPDLAALGLSLEDITQRADDEAEGDDEDSSTTNSESETKKTPSVLSRALAGGLSVEVDRASWRRVFIRIDDKADEAVIIVYGLMPGRQYDVDLELVQGQTMSRQVVTQDDSAASTTSTDTDTSNTAVGAEDSTPTRPNTPPPNNASPAQTPSGQPQPQPATPFSFAPLTLEDRIAQLQHTLSLLNSDTATLTASLKSARRDSQKADAALRSEIEVLKRAFERHAAGELRMKQKVLALQEAVKQANVSVTEIKAEIVQVEESIPEAEKARDEREEEYKLVLAEAEKMRAEREREEEVVRKRVDGLRNELNTLGKTQEKLEIKQEKLEGGLVKELQEKLDSVEKELEELEELEKLELESIHYASNPLSRLQGHGIGLGLGPVGQQPRSQAVAELSASAGLGSIGRPAAGLIQRPTNSSISSSKAGVNTPQARTPTTSPKQNTHGHVHNHSLPHHLQTFAHQNSPTSTHNQRSASISTNHHSHHSHSQHHYHPAGPHSHGPHGPHHNVRHHHGYHSTSHATTPVPTTILTNPNRRSQNSSGSIPTAPNMSSTTNSDATNSDGGGSGGSPGQKHTKASSSGTAGVAPTAGSSTLSSRATPFEPSKGFGMGMGLLRGSKPRGG